MKIRQRLLRTQATTISQIDAFSDAEIGNLELDIDLTHSRMSDLTMELRGPTSTAALVYEGGQWKLANPDAFQGELLAGSWQLAMTDGMREETGTLHGWTLSIIPLNRTYIYRTINGVDIHASVIRLGKDIQPVVMHMHGGASLWGHRDQRVDTGTFVGELWNNGYTVVSIDYRLCPAVVLSEIIDDTHVAYAWLRANGPTLFNVDIDRIGVTGSSMGGFLAILSGYQLQPRPRVIGNIAGFTDWTHDYVNQPNQAFLEEFPLISEEDAWAGFDTTAVLTNCPWDTPEFHERVELYRYLMQQGLYPRMATGLDPVADVDIFNRDYDGHHNVTSDYPPTVHIHGALDIAVEVNQSIIMDNALANAGVDSELIIVPDGEHLLSNLTEAQQAPYWQQARLFIDQYLNPHSGDIDLFTDSFENGQWNGLWVEDSQNDWFTSTQRATDGNYSAEVDGRATDATLTIADPVDLTPYGSAELSFRLVHRERTRYGRVPRVGSVQWSNLAGSRKA